VPKCDNACMLVLSAVRLPSRHRRDFITENPLDVVLSDVDSKL
jgi:hypothetical protein